MKFLFVVKQKKNVDTFAGTIRSLVERGHTVTLTVQEGQELRHDWIGPEIPADRLTVVRSPAARMDEWGSAAPLLRSLRDSVHYLRPALRDAAKLQARSVKKLREDLELPGETQTLAAALRSIPDSQVGRLDAILELAEGAVPGDPLWKALITEQAPDVVLLSPVVHFGSAQADVVAAARSLGIPVGMLLFSWDNLSTKGRLHQPPDWMFVWNERQRHEAAALHDFPVDRVIVAGAPRFDGFFDLTPQMTDEEFLVPLGLDPSQPTLLYLCSSAFVSSEELPFVRQWLEAIRRQGSHDLRHCNVIVRPHPDIDLLKRDEAIEELRWPAQRGMRGFVARPFGDPHAIVLRTSDRLMQGLYESIAHSAAVVGLNTSAELEAAIVGKPVYTILASERDADGQSGTIHFHYLVEEHGGFVRMARDLDEHVVMLDREIARPTDPAVLRAFVGDFLRPLGIDRPVSLLLAEAIERTFAGSTTAGAPKTSTSNLDTSNLDTAYVVSGFSRTEKPPVSLSLKGSSIKVYTDDDPETPGPDRFKPDPTTVEWLKQHVGVGDVVYDIGAGIGAYTVLAASMRGSIVVAFEPGYSAFKRLCDNLLLNGCNGSVIPLSLALSDAEGMAELKYAPGRPGQHRHSVRRAPWRVKRAASDDRGFVQPVLATTLDRAIERYDLPLPNHLRFDEHAPVASVLAAATAVISSERLKTIFVTLADEDYQSLKAVLDPQTWSEAVHKPISRNRLHVMLSRSSVPAAARPR